MRPGLSARWMGGGGACVVAIALSCAACSSCGKSSGGDPNVAPGAPSAAFVNRTAAPPDASPAIVRDVAMWTNAREGTVEDLASLATHEGAAGLVEGAAEVDLHTTAIRAMAYARGWAQLPYLVNAASGKSDDDAKLALESINELAARPRRAEDVEDIEELQSGCEKLGVLARDTERPRERRVPAIRALRMMPCPKQEIPIDLDAR
jgi:hypothetical protein